ETPTTEAPTTETNQSFIPEGYSLLQDELDSYGIPSMGDVNVLVFAIDFPDSPVTSNQPSLSDIETAFNGESNDLDFESVRSYYQLSSYNQLNINADVFGYYTMSQNASYYQTENEKYMAIDPETGEYVYDDSEVTHVESDIINELLTHYDDQINYDDYDSNNDGYIDGIYLIYNHPSESESDLWWAYQYNYSYTDTFDGVKPDYYMWASNDFLDEGDDDINARTYIHETGHMMGLDDYYDYSYEDDHNTGGLGTYMMDYNVGDHDPFSKILMGWIKPIVVESSTTIDIMPHLESGDVLLVTDDWKGTIFDEYILISYFTPNGLNAYDPDYIFTESGINMFHISAEIGDGYLEDSYYYSIFNNNNTDTPNKLINIIEADMNDNIEQYEIIENSDLFQTGDIFGIDIYPNYLWYDDSELGFTISIDAKKSENATITIIFE
ncbi:MAG: M6 family metalloprotease domain-containing protein, partial [Candidatus Izemoplasmatales bacterium]